MPEDYSGGSAADQLAGTGPSQTDVPPDDQADAPGGRKDTFFIPPDFPGAEGLKAGDMLPQMRVVGRDGDGGLEAEVVSPDKSGKPPWRQDLETSMGDSQKNAGY